VLNSPFSPWPSFTEEEANAVRDVILSNKVNYWTGQQCREFEKEFASWSGCAYAVALTNGTVALDLAFQALGIGAGDEVVVTSRTFLASVSSIVNTGATPVFADVAPDSQNITLKPSLPCSLRVLALSCASIWQAGLAIWTPSWHWLKSMA